MPTTLTHPARRSVRLAFALALSIGAFAAPAGAETFHDGGNVSSTSHDAHDPQLAVNASGDSAFVWRLDDGSNDVQARTRTGSTLGAITYVSEVGSSADQQDVAIDAAGNAFITWRRFNPTTNQHVIEARRLSTTGTLGPRVTLSSSSTSSAFPQISVGPDGDALVAWHRWYGAYDRVEARTLAADGTVGATTHLISDSGQDAGYPQVAFRDDGRAILSWVRSDGTYNRAQVRTLTTGGVLGAVSTLSNAPYSAEFLRMGVEPDGDALFTWQQSDGFHTYTKARTRTAGGALGAAVETLSGAGEDAYYPEVDVDDDGDAVVTWLHYDAGDWLVEARTRTASGSLGNVLRVSHAGQAASAPKIAVSAGGTAIMTWSRSDGADELIRSRKLYTDGTLGAVATLSDSGQDADEPQIGMADSGREVIAWQRSDGTGNVVQYLAAGAPPPLDDAIPAPAGTAVPSIP
jgi:hypothetical protein